jgi:ketopantoate reductase
MIQPPSSFANSKPSEVVSQVTVVGGGRIGSFFAEITKASVVTRSQSSMKNTLQSSLGPPGNSLQVSGPILVCVRNDDLDGVISAVPLARRKDLVFIQNGMIDTLLEKWCLEECTRGILYFAIEAKGVPPVDGGGTVFFGDYGPWLVSILKSANMMAAVVSREEFNQEMGRKLIWNSVFGILGEVYKVNVEETLVLHSSEIHSLVEELQSVFQKATGVSLGADLVERLVTYAKKVSHYQARASEWNWRNGWFLDKQATTLHKELSLRIGK